MGEPSWCHWVTITCGNTSYRNGGFKSRRPAYDENGPDTRGMHSAAQLDHPML